MKTINSLGSEFTVRAKDKAMTELYIRSVRRSNCKMWLLWYHKVNYSHFLQLNSSLMMFVAVFVLKEGVISRFDRVKLYAQVNRSKGAENILKKQQCWNEKSEPHWGKYTAEKDTQPKRGSCCVILDVEVQEQYHVLQRQHTFELISSPPPFLL